jgi:isopentenyl-diphosphate Delta-isomerase
MEQVVLVNEQDEVLGVMEKMEAHEKALLHRAFSIFIFNQSGELLLQQRAWDKYHSGGLWTNTCCSHPRPDESVESAAYRRLEEEMGFNVPLEKVFDFLYKADFDNGLTEHEFDHVFVGYYNEDPFIYREEVNDFQFSSIEKIESELNSTPEKFTAWFAIVFPKIKAWIHQNKPA